MSPPRPRVLVAEDDDDLRDLLAEVLGREFSVVTLEDGYELSDYLELTRRPHSRVPMPDLIVSDVCMPGRTGLEALERDAGERPPCPVVLISAFADDATRARARRDGVTLLVDKPLDVEVLAAAVGALLKAP